MIDDATSGERSSYVTEAATTWDAIVVGGGFAGVAAARDLSELGRSVLLLEARDRLGGRTWSRRFASTSVEVELGGTWVLLDQHHGLLAELKRYGIGTVATPAPKRFANLIAGERGSERALPEAELAPVATALVAAADTSATLADALAHSGATARARGWVTATIRYLFGTDPAQVGADTVTHPGDLAREDPEQYSHKIAGGTRHLLDAIAADAGAALRLGCDVVSVEQTGDGVRVRSAAGELLHGRVAVIALPVNAWGRVAFARALAPAKRAAARERHAGRSVKVWMLVRGVPEIARCLASDGPLAYVRTERRLPGGRALLVGFGWDGGIDPHDRAAVAAALRPLLPEAELLEVDGHDWNADEHARGTWFAGRPGQTPARLAGREGRLLFAGGDISADHAGTIEGAVVTGRAAAADAHALLGG